MVWVRTSLLTRGVLFQWASGQMYLCEAHWEENSGQVGTFYCDLYEECHFEVVLNNPKDIYLKKKKKKSGHIPQEKQQLKFERNPYN